MSYLHVTDAGEAILRHGFRDSTGSYMLATLTLTGVFISDQMLDINEGAKGEDVLEVVLPDDLTLNEYELVEDLKTYREWCVPARLLNAGRVRLLSEREVDAICYP
jgi:hypothetical protein